MDRGGLYMGCRGVRSLYKTCIKRLNHYHFKITIHCNLTETV